MNHRIFVILTKKKLFWKNRKSINTPKNHQFPPKKITKNPEKSPIFQKMAETDPLSSEQIQEARDELKKEQEQIMEELTEFDHITRFFKNKCFAFAVSFSTNLRKNKCF